MITSKSFPFLASAAIFCGVLAGCNSPSHSGNVTENGGKPGSTPEASAGSPGAPSASTPDTAKPLTAGDPLLAGTDPKKPPTHVTPLPSGQGTNGWAKTETKPGELAGKIDASLDQLANVKNEVIVRLVGSEGQGQVRLLSFWKSPKVFNVEFPGTKENHPIVDAVRSDGKTVATLQGQSDTGANISDFSAWKAFHPLGTVKEAAPDEVYRRWASDMPTLALGSYTEGKHVYQSLVKALSADPTIDVVTEERVKPYQGRLITNYRILATRKSDAIAEKGDLEFEIVVDSHLYLPVTMRTRQSAPGKKITQIDWASRWASATTFDKGKFKLPPRKA